MKRTGFQARTKPMARTSAIGVLGAASVQRKAPARKAKMKAKKIRPTAAESTWMDAVAELGCIVCRKQHRGYVPCAVHHIVEGGRRLGHMFTIGLCDPGHHQNTPDPEQISRHPNKARFTAAYGSEYDLLEQTKMILNWKAK